jgi:hypothetical protein
MDARILFDLENTTLTATRLQVGIDASGHPYAIIGHDLQGTPSTDTYTATTITLVDADITNETIQSLKVTWNEITHEISFKMKGITETQVATTKFDQDTTASDVLTIGKNAACILQSLKFNQAWYVINSTDDNTLTEIPDMFGSLNCLLASGTWVIW